MLGDHDYRLTTTWTGNRGTGTSGYRDYDREVTIAAEGKPQLHASADRAFHGNAERWNPEHLLVGALSQCHLLSYLHACVAAGIVVTGYRDEAAGTMRQQGNGGAFTEVVLRPVVTVAEETMVAAAYEAHHRAHEWCFIANSVNFPVRYEPTVGVSDARGEGPA